MSPLLPPLRLTGALTLRDGALTRRSVALAEGRITRGPLPEIDMTGYLVLPGIVDLHSEALPRHMGAPHEMRGAAERHLAQALVCADREAAAHGVTTTHLVQDWGWQGAASDGDRVGALCAAHADLLAQGQALSTDLRLKLRCQTHMPGTTAQVIATVARWRIGSVSFADALPMLGDLLRDSPQEFARHAAALGIGAEDLARAMTAAEAARASVPRHLCRLTEAFDELGVAYSSHADPDGETRERFSMIGARIADFPATRPAAAAAHAMGSPVILPAAALLQDRSPPGTTPPRDLIAAGLGDALASGEHPAALAQAAFWLTDQGLASLESAWAMISAAPSAILRLPDRGRLDQGMRADMVIVNARSRIIEATICAGRLAYLAGEAGRRFVAGQESLRLAAE